MKNKQKVLFICTGNSCRSQIAEGLLRNMERNDFEVFSAGSHPSRVHPAAITVMKEKGIDISNHSSDSIDKYLEDKLDIVITVCDNAKEVCPIFKDTVKKMHWSIEDPFRGWKSKESDLANFRNALNEIEEHIKSSLV